MKLTPYEKAYKDGYNTALKDVQFWCKDLTIKPSDYNPKNKIEKVTK